MAFPSLIKARNKALFPHKIDTFADEFDDNKEQERTVNFDYFDSTDYVKIQLQEALKIVEKMPCSSALSDIEAEKLMDASFHILRAEKALRKPLEYGVFAKEYDGKTAATLDLDEFCTVCRPENALICLRLPSLLLGSRGEWYSKTRHIKSGDAVSVLDKAIYRLVKAALERNIENFGPVEVSSETLFLVFRRQLPKNIQPRCAAYVDNNNVEAGFVTNAICEALHKGDNYFNLSFLYLAVPCDTEPFVEVILCKYDQLFHWLQPFQM